jgi:hypothetical protein
VSAGARHKSAQLPGAFVKQERPLLAAALAADAGLFFFLDVGVVGHFPLNE